MKNIVITGGGSGVGFSIAKDLASNNKIILVGRNENRLKVAQELLGDNVRYVAGDLSTTVGRENVVDYIYKHITHVDVLIHSAGIYSKSSQENIDNNLLSHYYLTRALLNLLGNSRVLIVTGNPQAIKMVPICELQLNDMTRAAWTVTHKTLLMYLLADQLKTQKTTVNSFFPGDVRSNLMPFTMSLSNTNVPAGKVLALDKNFENITGTFFDENGNTVELEHEKYNSKIAETVLSKYIPDLSV